MTALVSIILVGIISLLLSVLTELLKHHSFDTDILCSTDRLPLNEVAVWRSYSHIVATLGRSSGAPLGGLLADTVGWRW